MSRYITLRLPEEVYNQIIDDLAHWQARAGGKFANAHCENLNPCAGNCEICVKDEMSKYLISEKEVIEND